MLDLPRQVDRWLNIRILYSGCSRVPRCTNTACGCLGEKPGNHSDCLAMSRRPSALRGEERPLPRLPPSSLTLFVLRNVPERFSLFGKEDACLALSPELGGGDGENEGHERGNRACYNQGLLQARPRQPTTAATATWSGPEITSGQQTYFIHTKFQ